MAQSWSSWCWQIGLVSSLAMGGAIASLGDCASAQITPDGTLPNNSTVTPSGSTSLIEGGTQAGTNLFHSFKEFSVPTENTAYFNNAPTIENIFTRVTGGSASEIDGAIKANGTANLFLLNPNGIIFGSNARLNIGGSFVASTANSLKFSDGTQFSATEPQTTPLLTVSVPIGLQFGENTGRILVQGNGQGIRLNPELIDTPNGLRVPSNQTLALVGGDVVLEGGTLKTAGGRIELGSVADSNFVSLTPVAKGWSLGYEGIQNFRDIQLSQDAAVDASGAGGGDIQVQGRQVLLKDGSQIEASTLRSEPGGTLSINASELVELIGQSATTSKLPTYLVALVYPKATGTGGNVTVKTRQLIVRDGAAVRAGTLGQGQGGNLTVTASESTELKGTGTTPNGNRFPSGLFTPSDRDRNDRSGRPIGSAGDLTVVTSKLIVRDGAVVRASTSTEGKAGNLAVTAPEFVELSGKSPDGKFFSGLSSQTSGAGDAGDLRVETERLTVQNEAKIDVSSQRSGDTGNLQLKARSIRLDNSGKLTAITQSGKGGGNIRLENLNLLLLSGNSEISTTASGAGNGGNINIDTDLLVAIENSNIKADAIRGRGGNVRIKTQGLFRSYPDSKITASSEQGIDGVVEINRPDFDPSAELVILPANIVDVSSLIAQGCPAGGTNVASGESKFIVTGRGGLPPTPREALNSGTVLEDWGTQSLAAAQPQRSQQSDRPENHSPSPASTHANSPIPTTLVEAQGWVIGENGKVVLTAQAPTVTSHSPWLIPTACHGN